MLSPTTAANTSPLLERKIEEIGADIPASYSLHLRSAGQNNVKVIINYNVTMKSEVMTIAMQSNVIQLTSLSMSDTFSFISLYYCTCSMRYCKNEYEIYQGK
jgi:hypothetical protein